MIWWIVLRSCCICGYLRTTIRSRRKEVLRGSTTKVESIHPSDFERSITILCGTFGWYRIFKFCWRFSNIMHLRINLWGFSGISFYYLLQQSTAYVTSDGDETFVSWTQGSALTKLGIPITWHTKHTDIVIRRKNIWYRDSQLILWSTM